MPAYKYKAIDQNGIEVSGSLEGDTERHVRSIFKRKKTHTTTNKNNK